MGYPSPHSAAAQIGIRVMGQALPPGDTGGLILDCHALGRREGCSGMWWVEARDAAKCPSAHGIAPVSSVPLRKPGKPAGFLPRKAGQWLSSAPQGPGFRLPALPVLAVAAVHPQKRAGRR